MVAKSKTVQKDCSIRMLVISPFLIIELFQNPLAIEFIKNVNF